MPAPLNNKYNQHGPEPASSHLHVRVVPRNKAGWVKSAQAKGVKLAEWVVRVLNKESGQ